MNGNRFHTNIKRLMDAGYNVKVQRGDNGAVRIDGRAIDRALIEELYPIQLLSLVAGKIGQPKRAATWSDEGSGRAVRR
jgi:hypothetical protein